MSVPPPSSTPVAPELALALDGSRGRVTLRAGRLSIEHRGVLVAPLELPLSAVKVALVEAGRARVSGAVGRFPVLRRLGPTSVIPAREGIEGWLWTSTGGTALTTLGARDEAPNAALVFAKPLDDAPLRSAFHPEFVTALAARSPLGQPAVHGVLLQVADTLAAEQGFRRWGFQSVLTDREVPPTLRRHLPTDRPADPLVRGTADSARAATSVAPPGMS
jgi:hypothetical protein